MSSNRHKNRGTKVKAANKAIENKEIANKETAVNIDVKKYFSYNIPIQIQQDITAGSILNVKIETPCNTKDDDICINNIIYTKNSPAETYINYLSANDPHAFASTSKLYNKIMDDGYVFNPYLHRKYIASQTLQMLKIDWNKEFNQLSYGYCINATIEEISKLAFLSCKAYSMVEYEERSHFFTFEACKQIMLSYAKDTWDILKKALDKLNELKPGDKYYMEYYGHVDLDWVMRKFCNYTDFIANISQSDCTEYKYLAYYIKLLKKSEKGKLFKIKRNKEHKVNKFFRAAYQAAGAYYTMKYLIMFEHVNFEYCNQAQSLKKLYLAKVEEGYRLHAMLKMLLAKNNYEY